MAIYLDIDKNQVLRFPLRNLIRSLITARDRDNSEFFSKEVAAFFIEIHVGVGSGDSRFMLRRRVSGYKHARS